MSIFDAIWTVKTSRIPAGEESAVIEAAQAGDETATLRLLTAYMPALRAAVSRYESLSIDDARQAAIIGFMEAVHAFRRGANEADLLAGILRQYLHDALTSATSDATGGFSVPTRTMKRYFGILARANGDHFEAAKLAPDYEMTEDTWWSVYTAIGAEDSLEGALEAKGSDSMSPVSSEVAGPREIADAEDRVLCDLAFRSVSPSKPACALWRTASRTTTRSRTPRSATASASPA